MSDGHTSCRSRLFVLTDISEEEPDDMQSLIRLLLYSSEIEIEGLVATSSEWKSICGSGLRPDLIHAALDAYDEDRPNLVRQDPAFPELGALRALVASGNGNDLESTGPSRESEGSELLVQAIERDDPRPLWVAVWGGASTLAQALVSLKQRYGPGAELDERVSRIRVYEIQGQDDTGAWMAVTFPQLFCIRSQYQWRGMSNRVDRVWPEPRRYLDEFVSREWFAANIRSHASALSRLYPDARYMFEGDTPSFLNLVRNGLNDPLQIDQGGWGGRYGPARSSNVWSGGCPVNNEGRFGVFRMFSDAADALYVAGNGKYSTNVYNPVRRWRDAYQNDFAARMAWTGGDPVPVNHAPMAVVDGVSAPAVRRVAMRPGENRPFDASNSSDPDGDDLDFNWWIYAECSTAAGHVRLEGASEAICKMQISPDAPEGDVHLILELTDKGEPPLKTYRRILITIEP